MRGAGDSFGIAVRFYLRTESAPSSVIHFTYEMPDLWGNAANMAAAFFGVQRCVQDPRTSTGKMGLTVRMVSGSYRVAGYYYGKDNDPEF
jgi:hypothetical protein